VAIEEWMRSRILMGGLLSTTNVTRIQSPDKAHSLARSSTGHHGNEVLAEYDVGVELELGVLIAGS
jgi:hypothetical protein